MMKYTVKLKRSFLVTATSVSADSPEEATEKAWEYFDNGEVSFDEIVNKTVSVETETQLEKWETSESLEDTASNG